VKVSRAETVAASAPQKHKPLPAELSEGRRQGRDDQRVEGGGSGGAAGGSGSRTSRESIVIKRSLWIFEASGFAQLLTDFEVKFSSVDIATTTSLRGISLRFGEMLQIMILIISCSSLGKSGQRFRVS
jgi:hypothetical protein